jgi:hypothetical protein
VLDFTVTVDDRTAMVIKYGPGSLVTRYRPALAISRLVAPYQIPVVVVTNGESADILDGETGKLVASGFDRIPDREKLGAAAKASRLFSHFKKTGRNGVKNRLRI